MNASNEQVERTDICVLAGPTASGKTALALAWAAQTKDVEIISADSMLFYRGMDIGTAKPSRAEQAAVPHHLIDIREVEAPYSVAEYVIAAAKAVQEIQRRGNRVLVVGGSGFYLGSYFRPVVDDVEVPESVRLEVRALEARGGLAALVDRLQALEADPPRDLDWQNPRRIARALERRLATGRSLKELQAEFQNSSYPMSGYVRRLFRLDPSREELGQRIQRRTRAMLEAGWIDEVRALRVRGLERNGPAAASIGYRQILEHLEGKCDADELPGRIAQETRRLVRRQATWLRHQLPVAAVVDHASAAPWLRSTQ